MRFLPRVTALTRERISRELDDRGPEVCRDEIIRDLEANNPELLDMAMRCARDVGETDRVMTGFCMFYQLLATEARAALGASSSQNVLPRVSPATRAKLVQRIDTVGSQQFVREILAELEDNNPELLLMAHGFAEGRSNYLGVMEGFALLYAGLSTEAAQSRGSLH